MRKQSFAMHFFLIWIICWLPCSALSGETGQLPDFTLKETVDNARQLLADQNSTIKDLEGARQLLVEQKEKTQELRDTSSSSLRIFTGQLEAIGPIPDDAKTESQQVRERRKKLQTDISTAKELLLSLGEHIQELNVLIDEIDSNIHRQSTTALLVRGSSPLKLTNWPVAASELKKSLLLEKEAFQQVLEKTEARSILINRIPLILILFILGIITITAVRAMVMRRLFKFYNTVDDNELINWPAIAINSAHLGLPIVSLGLFAGGFYLLQLDIYGFKKTITLMPLVFIFLALGHWLGHSLFAPKQKELRVLDVDDKEAKSGYRILLLLGLSLALLTAQGLLEINYQYLEASKAVLTFPIIIMGSILLWLLSIIIGKAHDNIKPPNEGADAESAIQLTLLLLLKLFLRASALFSTIFIILGFTHLSREVMGPMLATVAILSLCFFLFRILINLLEPLLNHGSAKRDSSPTLLPVILILFIGMVALPVLALTWGIRWATLVDIWWLLKEGIKIGETRLSLDIIFLLSFIFIVGIGLTRWLQKLFRATILPRTKLDVGGQNALITGVGYIGIILSALIAISAVGLDLSNLAIFAGALSVGIGFGLQTIASNFVSGIILLIERPIKEGDWIDVAGYSGYVRKISVRSTRIETFDRHDVIIPNAELVAGVVKNMTLTGSTGRVIVPVGVAYGTDADRVKQALLEIAENHRMVLKYPKPNVLFMGLGESSIDFELRCFISDVNSMLTVLSDINFAVYNTFGKEGIEIPFPQRVVTVKKEEKLSAKASGEKQEAVI